MYVAMVRHYPVKSMLGGSLPAARLGPGGVEHDRALAVLDTGTGLVATAKHPRLWRGLLAFTATVRGDDVLITSPQGWSAEAGDPRIDGLLSDALGRSVRLTRDRPSAASVERTDPEDVLALGVDARVAAPTLRIGQGSPGSTFVDYAPVHVITTATLEHVGAELVRYRPNIVVETPPGTPAFVENDWVGKELRIGRERPVVLRVTLPTPPVRGSHTGTRPAPARPARRTDPDDGEPGGCPGLRRAPLRRRLRGSRPQRSDQNPRQGRAPLGSSVANRPSARGSI